MHEINIHTQRSDKYENKLGSDNVMKRKKDAWKLYLFPIIVQTSS